MITKTERAELRSVVKQQFKVLRAEIKQREAELRSEANEQLVAEVGETDTQWDGIEFIAREAVNEANRKINDALRAQGMAPDDPRSDYHLVELDWRFSRLKKKTDVGAAQKRIDLDVKERVKRAELAVERQEADLLRTLSVDALESEEARAFVKTIPTVAQLVPSARLDELIAGVIDE